jgi:diadenosine tetraphosphate (Ap4A) HIT family hydrolase
MSCVFCDVPVDQIVAASELAYAMRDHFPVNPGHTLLIPKRHVETWFEASGDERRALFELLDQVKAQLDAELKPDGYNIGINAGRAAGQTVMHLHVHLIPRFKGDVEEPAGGVRFVLPRRGNYQRPGFVPAEKK